MKNKVAICETQTQVVKLQFEMVIFFCLIKERW